jgi:1,4-alpha-glucan branching enzyme
MRPHLSPFINKRKKTIEFHIQNACAGHITLAGSFNHWAQDELELRPAQNGMWQIEIPYAARRKVPLQIFY